MASINELLAAHEYKYGRPAIKNTLFESIGNAIADRQARIDEERKAQRDQQMAINLLAKKFEYEQQQEVEKQKRVVEENARQNAIFEQMAEMDNRTSAGDAQRVVEGGTAKELERKARVLTSAKRVIKDGVVSTEVTQKLEDPADIAKREAEQSKQIFDMSKDLRDGLRKSPVFKDFQEIRRAGGAIDAAYTRAIDPSIKDRLATDQALVTAFNKMLDPGSVVRESEYARTAEGQAYIQSVMGRINQLFKGGTGLTDQGRKEIKMMSDELLNRAGQNAMREAEVYGNIADKFNIPRDLLFAADEFNFDSIPTGARTKAVDVKIDSVAPSIAEGTTIRNPKTGERKIMRGGQWQTL